VSLFEYCQVWPTFLLRWRSGIFSVEGETAASPTAGRINWEDDRRDRAAGWEREGRPSVRARFLTTSP
jgi:hypothetical protein